MRRRQVLAATTLLLSGCASLTGPGDEERSPSRTDPAPTGTPEQSPTGTPAPTPTETPPPPTATPEPTPTPEPTLQIGEWGKGARVESVAVQREFVCAHVWREHHVVEDAQFLVLSTDGASDWNFWAVLDGKRIDRDPPEEMSCARVLPIPVGDYGSGVVRMEDGPAWELTDDHLAALGAASDFRLRSASVAEIEGDTALGIEVENVGDRDGTFRGIVVSNQTADHDDVFTVEVPAGERVRQFVRHPIIRNWDPGDELLGEVTADTRRFVVGHP